MNVVWNKWTHDIEETVCETPEEEERSDKDESPD
jgi:hypothetical protein